MPLSFMKDTVTILRAPLISKNGMEKRDWTNAEEKTVSNVQVTAQSTSRDFEGRVTQVSDRRTLRARYDADIEQGDRIIWNGVTYVPDDADIEQGDRIIWNGVTYEIDGEVFKTKSPSGRVSSTRCTLARWEG